MSSNLSVWQRLYARVQAAAAQDPYVRVGVLASKGGTATAEVGEGTQPRQPVTLCELAAIHEFGSPAAGIPERSFIRRTFVAAKPEFNRLAQRLARAYLLGKIDLEHALGLIGQWGAAAVKKTVTSGEGVPPPNAPSTIARKGSSRPLVDTGQLVGAVTYEIVDGSGGDS